MDFLQKRKQPGWVALDGFLNRKDRLQDKNALIAPPTPTAAAIRNNQSINVFLYVARLSSLLQQFQRSEVDRLKIECQIEHR